MVRNVQTFRGKPSIADVVIVFGAAVWEGGEPSPSLRRRAVHGARIILSGRASVLLATGGIGRQLPSEAAVIRRLAIEQSVSDTKIILEEDSSSTLESAIACSKIMKAHGWSSAWIVSDHYHIFRCVFLMRQLGILAWGSPPDRSGLGTKRLRWYYLHLREIFAIPWSMLRVIFPKLSTFSQWLLTLGEKR